MTLGLELAHTSVDPPPGSIASSRYQPTLASLNARQPPPWFADARFGVFIHWGLFSIPGFAPKGTFAGILKTDYDRAMLIHPYAEDYWNAIKDPATPSAAFHRARYGTMPYEGFKPMFVERLARWDAAEWARTFRQAGAKYVVMVAKYHDGFCLWPTAVRNPHQPDWFTERDLVGEMAAAVRREGLRFGIYYSGGVDWTFRRRISRTLADYIESTPGGDYPTYADRQVRELIARYHPDILWNDIAWPTDRPSLFRLFADYYAAVPDGLVNDRWSDTTALTLMLRLKPARLVFDVMMKQAISRQPDFLERLTPSAIPHSDFTTPEYTAYPGIQAKPWEMTRGMGNSFGYNRNETGADYAPIETLLEELVDATSKNGNLLLNVGPRGDDNRIPPEQASRLAAFGGWLADNGDAIYGTRPWTRAETRTGAGEEVRFTMSGGAVNVIVLGQPTGSTLTLKGVQLQGAATLKSDGSRVSLDARADGDTALTFEHPLDGRFAPVVAVGRKP